MVIERISIEVTNRCAKSCCFCYNHSHPSGSATWDAQELTGFVEDCAGHGLRAVSFGGGEPLEYDPLMDVLASLRGLLFRSLTTNGLLLSADMISRLASVGIEKVHVSIHFPDRLSEVDRVIRQAKELMNAGIRSGVNLLVTQRSLQIVGAAANRIRQAGIGNDRIVYLPMRLREPETPTPAQISEVAGRCPFQSTSCLGRCSKSPRFCSIDVKRTVGWCSYTAARRPLAAPTYAALSAALDGLGLISCGGRHVATARLSRSALNGHGLVRGGSRRQSGLFRLR